jgi:hypothetical protein
MLEFDDFRFEFECSRPVRKSAGVADEGNVRGQRLECKPEADVRPDTRRLAAGQQNRRGTVVCVAQSRLTM